MFVVKTIKKMLSSINLNKLLRFLLSYTTKKQKLHRQFGFIV